MTFCLQSSIQNWSTLKRKEFAPNGSKFFTFRIDPSPIDSFGINPFRRKKKQF